MITHVGQTFNNYSESALEQVIEQCPGKPVHDGNGKLIGTIISGKRIGVNTIEFKIDAKVI